ncbi:MAG TPA: SigmaK-factor processing regulatory BofA [Clostridiales bacterium]|nr:SigmaK-factor processing regulatory BofA [Clostridiales bacterium]HBK03980.1 SigmaK-factor processing regulatory BofA [Clostridiales bacterium]
METFVTLLIPAILAIVLIRLLLMPLKLGFKIALHCACGFVCLWLLNSVSGFTGIYFPINAVTVLVSGVLGLPGIAVLAILAVL